MSKAFTKEEDASDTQGLPRLQSPLKPGEKNFLTESGAKRLRHELHRLEEKRSPLVAVAQVDGDARRELQILDQRRAYLEASLRTAVVVAPDALADDCVRFGATVTVKDRTGKTTPYRLVGVDETDHELNWISWQSPIARALLKKRVGDRVVFKFPAGESELEIVGIEYT